jgi:hypothetical protein
MLSGERSPGKTCKNEHALKVRDNVALSVALNQANRGDFESRLQR